MAALTEHDKGFIYAMELLRKQLEDSALGIAANTKATEDDYKARAKAIGDWMAAREKPEAVPAADVGSDAPHQRALKEFQNDPDRKEASAKKALESAQRGERQEKLNANPLYRVLSEVAGKFQAIVGPAALVSAVLNSTVSGFGTLQKSVQVFASTIAPLLLPVTLSLSAAMLALADVVGSDGVPIIEKWTEFILNDGIPAIVFLVDMFAEAAKGAQDFAEGVADAVAWVKRQIDAVNPFGGDDNSDERTIGGMQWSGREGGDKVSDGLRDSLQSLRQSVGSRGTVSALAGIGQGAQQAVVQGDPIEQRLMRQQIATLERIEAKLPGRAAPRRVYDPERTGRGDYERGTGSASGGDYGEGE